MKHEPQHSNGLNDGVGVHKLTRNLGLILPCQNVFIAYSGGVDSHTLLHLCANDQQIKDKITAVYINHGLQPEANAWAGHCESVSLNLGVRFIAINVDAKNVRGESPEEAARNARYAAIKPLLGKDDVLLLAQHADDQLETVLLQLFRGSGLQGLAGMPRSFPFGLGVLIRPLLDFGKDDIIGYAKDHALQWVEDSSNCLTAFDRNFLRHEILPLIKQRWPSLAKTVTRSARHCADARDIIGGLADESLASAINADLTLNVNILHKQISAYQPLIIRQWFHRLGLKMPSEQVVHHILGQIVRARAGANPILKTQGRQIRRFRQRLYCILPPPLMTKAGLSLPRGEMSFKVADNIHYDIVPSADGIPAELWRRSTITIRYRSGGECIRLSGRSGTHDLKKLFQEVGVPPWERQAIPLIYLDGKLAAVGDWWIAADYYSQGQGHCLRLAIREAT